jgi:hypothetical protein
MKESRESLKEDGSHVKGFEKGLEQNSLRRSAYKEWFSNAREWFTGRLAAGHVRLKGG